MEHSETASLPEAVLKEQSCMSLRNPYPSRLSLCCVLLALAISVNDRFRGMFQSNTYPAANTHERFDIIDSFPSDLGIPPIESLISKNGTIIGDISWMLDFAIIAFPKGGTTFMKDYLRQSPQIFLFEREFCMKSLQDVVTFVKIYHKEHLKFQETANQQRHRKNLQFGLKCPGVLYRDDIEIYRQYFPLTKLIVGLRHPVTWFESFYNYQMYRNVSLPATTQLMGRCFNHQKVCTDRARFHAALARLGLTELRLEHEITLLLGFSHEKTTVRSKNQSVDSSNALTHRLPNTVFVYELRQIHDKDASKNLSIDIQKYIQLSDELSEISSYTQNKTRAINICDDEHKEVRKVLVKHSIDAADWIELYFVKSSSVVVSSPSLFFRLLNDWRRDPCEVQ